MIRPLPFALALLLALAGASHASAQSVVLITPISATASSEWNSSYSINHTINGSGLPLGFTIDTPHADYSTGNHWTTGDNKIVGEFANFDLGTEQSLTQLYLWNHRSSAPLAYSAGYAVTQFELSFYDSNSQLIKTEGNFTASGGIATAQTFNFEQVDLVRSVRLTINANNGEPRVTGLAEVRFGFTPIPEPSTYALMAGGGVLAALATLRRRRRERR